MTTFRSQALPSLDTESHFRDNIVAALLPHRGSGDSLTEIVTGEVFDSGSTLTWNSDGSITGTAESVGGLVDNNLGADYRITSHDFIFVVDINKTAWRNANATICNLHSADGSNRIKIAEGAGSKILTVTVRIGGTYLFVDSEESLYGNHQHVVHWKASERVLDIYTDGQLFSSTPHTNTTGEDTQEKTSLLLGSCTNLSRLYSYNLLTADSFSQEEIATLVADPYQLFQTEQDSQQAYCLKWGDSPQGLVINPTGDSSFEIEFAQDVPDVYAYLFDTRPNGGTAYWLNRTGATSGFHSGFTNDRLNGTPIADRNDISGFVVGSVLSFDMVSGALGAGITIGYDGTGYQWQGLAISTIKITDDNGTHHFDFNQTNGTVVKSHTSDLTATLVNFNESQGAVRAWGVSDGLPFDGSTQYADIPAISLTDFDITIKFATTVTSNQILLGDDHTANYYFNISSQVNIFIAGLSYAFGGSGFQDGKLHEVRYVLVGTALEVSLDGEPLGSQTVVPYTGSNSFVIGGANSVATKFNGVIQSVEFAGQRYYDFTKVTNASTVPETLNGNDGTLNGFTDVYVAEKSKQLIGMEFDGGNGVEITGLSGAAHYKITLANDLPTSTTSPAYLFDARRKAGSVAEEGTWAYLYQSGTNWTINNLTNLTVDGNSSGTATELMATAKAGSVIEFDEDGELTVIVGCRYNESEGFITALSSVEVTDTVSTYTYDFTQDVGDSILDTSGNDNHGTVVGGALRRVYEYSGWGEYVGHRFNGGTSATIPAISYDLADVSVDEITFIFKAPTVGYEYLLYDDTANFLGFNANGNIYWKFAGSQIYGAHNLVDGQEVTVRLERNVSAEQELFVDGVSINVFTSQRTFSISEIGKDSTCTLISATIDNRNYDFTTGDINLLSGGTYEPHVNQLDPDPDNVVAEGNATYDANGVTFYGGNADRIDLEGYTATSPLHIEVTLGADIPADVEGANWLLDGRYDGATGSDGSNTYLWFGSTPSGITNLQINGQPATNTDMQVAKLGDVISLDMAVNYGGFTVGNRHANVGSGSPNPLVISEIKVTDDNKQYIYDFTSQQSTFNSDIDPDNITIVGKPTVDSNGVDLDGVDDYVSTPRHVISASENFVIEFKAQVTTNGNHNRWFGDTLLGTTNNRSYTLSNLTDTVLRMHDDSTVTFVHNALTNNQIYTFRFERADNANITLHIDGQLINTIASTAALYMQYIGTNYQLYHQGIFEYFTVNDTTYDFTTQQTTIGSDAPKPFTNWLTVVQKPFTNWLNNYNRVKIEGGVTYDESGVTLDGTTGYVDMITVTHTGAFTDTVNFVYDSDQASQAIIGNAGGSNALQINSTTTVLLRFVSSSVTRNFVTPLVVGQEYTWKLVRDGSDIIDLTDESDVSVLVSTTTKAGDITFDRIGARNNNQFFAGTIKSVVFDAARYYDFTDVIDIQSGGLIKPAIEETIQGKHAVISSPETSGFMPVIDKYVFSVRADGDNDYGSVGAFIADRGTSQGIQEARIDGRLNNTSGISTSSSYVAHLHLTSANNPFTLGNQDSCDGLLFDAGYGLSVNSSNLSVSNIAISARVTNSNTGSIYLSSTNARGFSLVSCYLDNNGSSAGIRSNLSSSDTALIRDNVIADAEYSGIRGSGKLSITNNLIINNNKQMNSGNAGVRLTSSASLTNNVISNNGNKDIYDNTQTLNNSYTSDTTGIQLDFANAWKPDGSIEPTWYTQNLEAQGWNGTNVTEWAVGATTEGLSIRPDTIASTVSFSTASISKPLRILPATIDSTVVYTPGIKGQKVITLTDFGGSQVFSPTTRLQLRPRPATIVSESTVFNPNLLAEQFIQGPFIDSTNFFQPIVKQDKTIELALIDSTVFYGPTVRNQRKVTLGTIGSTSSMYSPEVTVDIAVRPTTIASTSGVNNPTVRNALVLRLPVISSSSSVFEPTTKRAHKVLPPLIGSNVLVFRPRITGGATVEQDTQPSLRANNLVYSGINRL